MMNKIQQLIIATTLVTFFSGVGAVKSAVGSNMTAKNQVSAIQTERRDAKRKEIEKSKLEERKDDDRKIELKKRRTEERRKRDLFESRRGEILRRNQGIDMEEKNNSQVSVKAVGKK